MNLEKHNLHWKEGFTYPFEKKRALFAHLVQQMDKRPIIALSGLRRTGKTILLKQLINALVQEKAVLRTNILYYSFDEEQPKIESIISEFERVTNCNVQKEKLFIFLDEIQKLDDWQNQVKFYYDTTNIKFVVSGSSSLFIRRKVKESLAGRCFESYLAPLSFREFLMFRNKTELIEKPLLYLSELKKELSAYEKRQFVEVVSETEEYVAEYVKSILEKVLYIDIPNVFPIENVALLHQLMKIIAAQPGMIIEYGSLAQELGINRITLSNYLFYLEEAFLIKKEYNFSRNRLTSEKKSKKFYLSCTSFFPYLCPEVPESKLVENLIAVESGCRFFWRTPTKDEVDFVREDGDSFHPIEVKWKPRVQDKELRSMVKFCMKFGVHSGTVITKEAEEKRSIKGLTLCITPAWRFLLI